MGSNDNTGNTGGDTSGIRMNLSGETQPSPFAAEHPFLQPPPIVLPVARPTHSVYNGNDHSTTPDATDGVAPVAAKKDAGQPVPPASGHDGVCPTPFPCHVGDNNTNTNNNNNTNNNDNTNNNTNNNTNKNINTSTSNAESSSMSSSQGGQGGQGGSLNYSNKDYFAPAVFLSNVPNEGECKVGWTGGLTSIFGGGSFGKSKIDKSCQGTKDAQWQQVFNFNSQQAAAENALRAQQATAAQQADSAARVAADKNAVCNYSVQHTDAAIQAYNSTQQAVQTGSASLVKSESTFTVHEAKVALDLSDACAKAMGAGGSTVTIPDVTLDNVAAPPPPPPTAAPATHHKAVKKANCDNKPKS